MIQIENKVECSGCHACYNVCPTDCIIMESDDEGFFYPKVYKDNCIDCGLCEKVCPILNKKEMKDEKGENSYPKTYACYNLNDQVRENSSSGGIFFLLASQIIQRGGIVYGAAFNKEMEVCHIGIEKIEELDSLQGAKYVQSRMGDVYVKIKEQLNKGRLVYFSGTPCQVDGLLFYLRKEYDNLFCQDLICHGVPSPKVWKRYLDYRNKVFGNRPTAIRFRDKKNGWKAYDLCIDYAEGIYRCDHWKDPYMKAFLRNYILRPSCYDCRSKSLYRSSDITLADFWGIESMDPSLDDDKGTSLVFINTKKGENLFANILENIIRREVDVLNAVQYNPSAYKSVQWTRERETFMKEVFGGDFQKVVDRYTKEKWSAKIVKRIKFIIDRI